MAGTRTKLGDVEIEWEEHGDAARTLLLVHGFTGARTDFETHFESLAQDRRVVAADHRGHGGSTNTGRAEDYTLDALTEDLIGFLEATVDGPADVLGHSMGGMVALRLVLRRPDLVRSLILMDTASEAPRGLVPPENFGDLVRELGVRAVVDSVARTPERELFARCKGAAWVESDTERRLSGLDREAFIGLLPQVFQCASVSGRLGEVECPTTVLVGGLDALFVPTSERLAGGIPGARLEVVEGAYHSPQHTHPEEWLARVRGHLEWADAAG
ncbi:MAG: alpha/beta hydrolase [Candidatus Binatia bacterium]|nr:alpha/beta hydrolase [Candidatus Binatia bacterium]